MQLSNERAVLGMLLNLQSVVNSQTDWLSAQTVLVAILR